MDLFAADRGGDKGNDPDCCYCWRGVAGPSQAIRQAH